MCIINIFFKNTVNIIVIVVHLLAELFCIVPLIGKVLFNILLMNPQHYLHLNRLRFAHQDSTTHYGVQ